MSEALNRDLKAAGIEQTMVEMGLRRVPADKHVRALILERGNHGPTSQRTWDRVQDFLADRFPDQ